jgi:ceramide kinase
MEQDVSSCLGIKYVSKVPNEIKLSDIYAVELIDNSSFHMSNLPRSTERTLLIHDIKVCSCSWLWNYVLYCFITFHSFSFLVIMQIYHFIVHGFIRSKNQSSHWILTEYTFGHKNLQTCEMWVNQLSSCLKLEVERPRNLLVCSDIGQTPAL